MAISRKRRRWLIGTVMLAGLLLAGWWFWPTGIDPRFVGTWQTDRVGDLTVTYSADGRSARNRQWRVRNGRFYDYSADDDPIIRIREELWAIYTRVAGKPPRYNFFKWECEVVEVGENRILLRAANGKVVELLRVTAKAQE